jgi:putative aminopeptidase FrvX
MEHDTTHSMEERMATCVTWWTRHKELLIEKKLTKNDLLRAMQMGKIVERKGAHTLIDRAEIHNIPFIIFSASGIGVDSIQMLMEFRGRSTKNISLVSNTLYRDDAGQMI